MTSSSRIHASTTAYVLSVLSVLSATVSHLIARLKQLLGVFKWRKGCIHVYVVMMCACISLIFLDAPWNIRSRQKAPLKRWVGCWLDVLSCFSATPHDQKHCPQDHVAVKITKPGLQTLCAPLTRRRSYQPLLRSFRP